MKKGIAVNAPRKSGLAAKVRDAPVMHGRSAINRKSPVARAFSVAGL